MNQFQQTTIRVSSFLLATVILGACGAQPTATPKSDWYIEQFEPGEFASMSIEERLDVMADLCPAGTKPYCRVHSDRDQCSCVEDAQMRRNLEALIR